MHAVFSATPIFTVVFDLRPFKTVRPVPNHAHAQRGAPFAALILQCARAPIIVRVARACACGARSALSGRKAGVRWGNNQRGAESARATRARAGTRVIERQARSAGSCAGYAARARAAGAARVERGKRGRSVEVARAPAHAVSSARASGLLAAVLLARCCCGARALRARAPGAVRRGEKRCAERSAARMPIGRRSKQPAACHAGSSAVRRSAARAKTYALK